METIFSQKNFFQRIGTGLFLVVCLLLAFLTSEVLAESLEEGAKREGKVMFYTTIPTPYTQMLTNAFQKKHPFIKAEFYRAGDNQLLGKVQTEKRMGQTFSDVLGTPGVWANVYKKEGLLAKYVSPESKFIPPGFKDPDGFWTADYTAYYTFIYNTKMIAKKDVPKTYEDLLNPKWKGKIGMSSNEVDWFMGVMDVMGEEKGMRFMKRLGEQEPILRNGRTLTSTLMVAGEYPLALSVVHTTREQQRAGASLDMISFPSPTLAGIRLIGIHANAPHPNAAKLFVDFMLSKDGQGIFNRISYHPVRTDVQIADPVVEEIRSNLFPIKPKDANLVESHQKEFDKIFKKR